MTDTEFSAYVAKIVAAATAGQVELVEALVDELQEKSYLAGRQAVVDGMWHALQAFGARRPRQVARKSRGAPVAGVVSKDPTS